MYLVSLQKFFSRVLKISKETAEFDTEKHCSPKSSIRRRYLDRSSYSSYLSIRGKGGYGSEIYKFRIPPPNRNSIVLRELQSSLKNTIKLIKVRGWYPSKNWREREREKKKIRKKKVRIGNFEMRGIAIGRLDRDRWRRGAPRGFLSPFFGGGNAASSKIEKRKDRIWPARAECVPARLIN